jgi:hypothetical protein
MTKTESGQCEDDAYSCYTYTSYWRDLSANADGPLLSVLAELPEWVRVLFYTPKPVTTTETKVSAHKWKVADAKGWDKLDKTELKLEKLKTMIESARVDQVSGISETEVTLSEDEWNAEETLSGVTIKESDYVTLESGSSWIPADVSHHEETKIISVVTVKDKLIFISIIFLLVLLIAVSIMLLI